MKHNQKDKKNLRCIIIDFIIVLSCLMFKENVLAWDWDGYYSGVAHEEYDGDGSTDYRAHFEYRFTSNSGKLHINFIDAYNSSTISSYSIDVWGDASGLSSYGWNQWTAPDDINMAVYKTGGQDLGINFTNGSHVSTSRVMIDSRSPTDGMPYKQRFEAPLRYSIPAGYTTNPSGWNSNNQGSLSLNENRYQSNGGRGGTIRQFVYTRNGRFDYWCMVPAPENPSTLTNSSFTLTGALTSDVGLSTNFPGFYTTTSKTLNIYLYRNEYVLTVNPNGGSWNGYTTNVWIAQQWGTTRAIPYPTASPYMVTLNANGGSGSTTRTATRPFSGWTQSGVGTLSGTTFTFGIGNKTLTANYSTNSIALPTPTRTGYKCTGWYTAGGIKRGEPGGSYTPNQSETLYAQWTPAIYYLNFYGNGQTGGTMAKMTLKYDTSYTLTSNAFIKTGYTFQRWLHDGTSNYYNNQAIVKNLQYIDGTIVNFNAQWAPNTYYIAFNGNGSTSGSIASITCKYDSAYTLTDNSYAKTGYTFTGWNTKANGAGTTYVNKASIKNLTVTNGTTITLYAQWIPNTYHIAFDGNGATSGSMNKMTCKYDSSYALELNKFVKDDFDFIKWNTKADGTGISYTNSQVVDNLTTTNGATITLYAQWKKDITITYNANGGSGEPPAEKKTVYNSVASASFTISSQAPTRKGYTFKGWSEDSSSVIVQYEPGSIQLFDKNTILYAVWENNLGVNATITRMLSPHDPIFKKGETGILTIHTTGFAERVTVSFQTTIYPEGEYNTEYVLNSDDEFSDRESTFIIPLYCEEGEYIVEVTAYRGEQSMIVYPSLTVEGTVLDDLKTRIRS